LEDDTDASPVERLRTLINVHIKALMGHRKTSGLLLDLELKNLLPDHRKKIVELRDTHDRILCKIIRDGIDSGDFVETDERLACYFIASMIIRSRLWFSLKGRLSLDEIADYIFRFTFNALRCKEKETNTIKS
jgi:tetracycline repressor-like protein